MTIVNRGSGIVYLNYGTSGIANAGIGLNPGGSSHVLNIRGINCFGAISAIVASGTALKLWSRFDGCWLSENCLKSCIWNSKKIGIFIAEFTPKATRSGFWQIAARGAKTRGLQKRI
ncbi:hypothetical protein [Microseira wollei]|uniref:hypothetical protein n=1 Tax=Microseira wollei TaxID=467598 RepID=UPI001CFE7B1F|nr:hypothetical protein [Microseira wollei]